MKLSEIDIPVKREWLTVGITRAEQSWSASGLKKRRTPLVILADDLPLALPWNGYTNLLQQLCRAA